MQTRVATLHGLHLHHRHRPPPPRIQKKEKKWFCGEAFFLEIKITLFTVKTK